MRDVEVLLLITTLHYAGLVTALWSNVADAPRNSCYKNVTRMVSSHEPASIAGSIREETYRSIISQN